MSALKKVFESAGVIVGLWIAYNMLIFALIASGGKMSYVPYLNFPIKLFLLSFG